MAGGFQRVEISADRVDRTRAVTTRLTKRDPTNRKSVHERRRKIWQVGCWIVKKSFSLIKCRDPPGRQHLRGAKRFFNEGFKVLKSSASTFALLEINQFYGRLGGADCDRRLVDFNETSFIW